MSSDRPPSASRGMGHSASMPAGGLRRGKLGGAGRKSADHLGSRRNSNMSPGGHGRTGGSVSGKGSTFRKPVKLTIRDIVVRRRAGAQARSRAMVSCTRAH